MNILICGSRNWANVELIRDVISRIKPTLVIHGGCSGADALASLVAEEMGIPVHVYAAEWKSRGRAAGPIRNQRMLDEGKPDLVLAFHNDLKSSRGTSDMVRRAQERNVPVQVVSEDLTLNN